MTQAIPIEATRVGDPLDLPCGTSDPELLQWAQRNNRFLVTADRSTMFLHFNRHLEERRASPGVFVLSRSARIQTVVEFLAMVSEDDSPQDWKNRIEWIG